MRGAGSGRGRTGRHGKSGASEAFAVEGGYARRKETIERVFADAKEKHGMRYTLYRGLTQVSKWVKLKFAAMNLKKPALWKSQCFTPHFFNPFPFFCPYLHFTACLDRSRQAAFRQTESTSIVLEKHNHYLGGSSGGTNLYPTPHTL